MSNTAHYTQIAEPELLDVVDDAWLQDKLPDDSELQFSLCCCCKKGVWGAFQLRPQGACTCTQCQYRCLTPTNPSNLPAGVPLPQGMQIFVEELDEQQEQRPAVKKERWLDLGLHQLH